MLWIMFCSDSESHIMEFSFARRHNTLIVKKLARTITMSFPNHQVREAFKKYLQKHFPYVG